MSRKLKLSGIAIGLIAAICTAVFLATDHPGDKPLIAEVLKGAGRTHLTGSDPLSDQFVRELQKYYGATISETPTQASLAGLRDYFMTFQGSNGKGLFYSILKRAFPDHADAIMKTLAKLDQYEAWLHENREMLIRLSPEERMAAMWKKRRELFGLEAERIWTGEMLSADVRKEKVKDTLAVLNNSESTTMDEKLEVYQGVLNEAYEGTPEKFILDQHYLLAKVFFSIESVQKELKQMSPEQRQSEINRLRRKMGFTQKQIESMERRDADNERRWEVGLKYMQDREEAVKNLEGQQQEEKLKELREKYFLDEANTIGLEEKDGFFRFKREHIYGRN